MRVNVSAKIKISATTGVVRLVKWYERALQHCINTGYKRGIRNNIRLQPFVYKALRSRFHLPAQHAVSCIKQACGILKKAKSKPVIRHASVRFNFPRSANLKGQKLSIRTINGREEFDINIPACYKDYFSWDVKESLLRLDRKGRCFFLFTFSKEVGVTEQDIRSHEVLGIDLGVNNLAVCSDGRFYHSNKVKQVKRKFKFLRGKLQAKGTRSAKRLLKRLSGRETRFMTWVNHNVSKSIVAPFEGGRIVMENLKGIRKQHRGRIMNYWISNWSFYQLQSFIQYKANMRGVEVDFVNPAFTSQICHKCGHLGTRLKGCFCCSHCGLSNFNSDLNAGRNLAHPMLVERQAAVARPYSRSDDVKSNSQVAIATEFMAKSPRTLVVG